MPFVPPGIGLQVDKELRIVTKVRSKETFQKMADIPKERPVPSPLLPTLKWMFFGPWQMVSRKARGASSKQWGILFTCFVIRTH